MTPDDKRDMFNQPPERALKVDIVVHGRFHGFALARALIGLGQDVLVHTNYPVVVVEKFGVPRKNVRSFVMHGLASRIAHRASAYLPQPGLESALHRMFGRWAARSVRPEADVVYGFTGVMEEFLRTPRSHPQLRTVVRGSAHIRHQFDILAAEAERVGVPLERPSRWMLEREEREYHLADRIFVLSEFARRSFIDCGVALGKVRINPLGVDVTHFKGSDAVRTARQTRILSGSPLRVLNVGTFSYRKGARDFVEIAAALAGKMEFRFVGDTPAETTDLATSAERYVKMIQRVPERTLADQYAWADIFIFPTIEDGFAAVLLQASAGGLPIIATQNCSAPDFLLEGKTGWVVSIRDPSAFVRQLTWCDANRKALAQMAFEAGERQTPRGWLGMAAEFLTVVNAEAERNNARPDDH